MARLMSLAHAPLRDLEFEFLRAGIVCSCALALIAAGQALPF